MLQICAATHARAWFRQCPSPIARARVRHRRRAQRACVNAALGRQFGRRRRRVLRHRDYWAEEFGDCYAAMANPVGLGPAALALV